MAESKGLFSRLKQALTKTRDNFSQRVEELISYYREIDDEFFEELTDLDVYKRQRRRSAWRRR